MSNTIVRKIDSENNFSNAKIKNLNIHLLRGDFMGGPQFIRNISIQKCIDNFLIV